MTAICKDQAIILNTRPFKENDLLVLFFGRNSGKISSIARSAKRSLKRFGGGLDSGSEVIAHFTVKSSSALATLSEIELLDGHLPLRRNIAHLSAAAYVIELVMLATADEEANEALYDLLSQSLSLLEERVTPTFIRAFELKFLALLGYRPNCQTCTNCQAEVQRLKNDMYPFSIREGGLLCPHCTAEHKSVSHFLPEKSLFFLRALQRIADLKDALQMSPAPEITTSLDALLPTFISHRLEKPLRSLAFLRSVLLKG
ncbi:MAG: DNA repair protein RecO [Deltaproteobacteria bacterium]|nr:DNA repair protein RecO [Deltaproteobacteria bacterium]